MKWSFHCQNRPLEAPIYGHSRASLSRFFTYSMKSTIFPCQFLNVTLKSLKSVRSNTSSAGTSEIVMSVSFACTLKSKKLIRSTSYNLPQTNKYFIFVSLIVEILLKYFLRIKICNTLHCI